MKEKKCGPTHHLACDCREARVNDLVEALNLYANKQNWALSEDGDSIFNAYLNDDEETTVVGIIKKEYFGGVKAREALEKFRGEE